MIQEFGVNEIAQKIHTRLQRYLEAQYHIKDTSIIEERKSLLEEPGSISQRPYIEVTPSYAAGTAFSEIQTPKVIANLLSELSKFSPSIGVFPPYKHQSDALESFFAEKDGKDLIVATGTGSGKTETFLYTILGLLALEAEERQYSFQKSGVRTLLLYPMNALVSDQTSRLRRLFGNENFAGLFRERWGRHPKFGMYTSRTPYPGLRSNSKDGRDLAPLIKYYADLEASTEIEKQALVDELKKRGRFPAKNIISFFNESVAQQNIYQSGKKAGQSYTSYHWEARFSTHPDDRELLTRHEIQKCAPDLLVTNYSMLEYMMLRPIEASIFDQTKQWLQSDERNQFLLILDEAHMYRGVGGAEVGFLIRRLMSRLGINRDRLRCILTSASLGDSEEGQLKGIEFANGLTGKTNKRSVAVIRGTREERRGAKTGTDFEANGLILVDEEKLASADINPESAFKNIKEVADKLNWSVPSNLNEKNDLLQIRKYVTEKLTGFGPLELLIQKCSGNATDFNELAKELFPDLEDIKSEQATNGLLALGTFARRTETNRDEQPLLPTRVHMLYRGLPAIYACINSKCSFRRDNSENNLLGRLYIEPRTHCRCGSRVYELYTHRDCGTAFLRVFGVEYKRDFFWHESGGKISSLGDPLHEFHLLIEEPHPTYGEVIPIWVDVQTGRVKMDDSPDDLDSSRLCYMASNPLETESKLTTFKSCPVCLKRTANQRGLKIMDLSTKGEQPFANLIREQFVCQIPTKPFNSNHPNGGRKSLLFSDGRQKAARLARDLPREVERDSFREALVLAIKKLNDIKKDAAMDEKLYASFIAVCAEFNLHFFDKSDQEQLIEGCLNFNKYFDADFEWFLDESGLTPTLSFRKALLRQISDPYYSLVSACAANVEPKKSQFKIFQRGLGEIASPEIIEQVTLAWIQKMLSKMAYDPAIPFSVRMQEFQYFDKVSSDSGLPKFFDNLKLELNLDQSTINQLRDSLFNFFTANADGDSDSGKLLKPQLLQIRLTLNDTWWQCKQCGNLQLKNSTEKCENCKVKQLEPIYPNHPYMTARKGFFREPLIAVLNGERPIHITAEEHTAQLSQRDSQEVYATTEKFELLFQDVPLNEKTPPVDVLSCTTTMEVGIDIGSLTAVGLRTIPPQRENYQQRAGRAGRRGTSISSVITFAEGGSHDAYYFGNPKEMISGSPREPRIKIDNPRLAKRHINSYLLQTFFYEKLESLSEREKEDIIKNRPNLMSAYGDVQNFFEGGELFSFHSFKQWIDTCVKGSESFKMNEVISWLPDDLFGQDSSEDKKRNFIENVIDELLAILTSLRDKYLSNIDQPSDPIDSDEEDRLLLNVLFNQGLLPSYAFPTDLCSFYILKRDNGMITIKERPQLAKAQALSEYAPGRLLVVNKETYRVGGILFYPITTSKPAEGLFGNDLKKYIGCPNCTYLRLEEGDKTSGNLICPICRGDLYVRELIDPPDFAPEGSRPLSERDRDQDITYATSAELPEVADREEFVWEECSGMNLQFAKKEDIKLIVVNKGKDFRGFDFCESCGAGWISETDTNLTVGSHQRPFLIPGFVYKKEAPPNKCSGEIRKNIFLEHQFLTDIFLLRIPIKFPIDFGPDKPWLRDALTTLAEAFTLSASLHLDIDPSELGAGFRMLASMGDENGNLEIFLYDTTSGGAGYAYEAGENLVPILERTKLLLSKCTNDECETSCTKCLRHYGNRFLHTRLNRKLGLQLLEYAVNEKVPEIEPLIKQKQILAPLARFLELEGWETSMHVESLPLSAVSKTGRRVSVGVYPALLEQSAAIGKHILMRTEKENTYLLPDYLVQNDLPTAYQTIINTKPLVPNEKGKKKVATEQQMRSISVIKLTDFLSGIENSGNLKNLPISENAVEFTAIEVDFDGLSTLGIYSGDVLILKKLISENFEEGGKFLIQSSDIIFKATNRNFTVANIKPLTFAEDKFVQISYSKPESIFRPERYKAKDIKTLGLVVKVISNGN